MSDVVEAARKYLGAKWRHQGRKPGYLDCAGLVLLAYRDCGHEMLDVAGYGRQPWKDGLLQAVQANLRPVKGEIEPGDVLLFRMTKEPQHLAIATDTGMIHAIAGRGVVEHGLDAEWTERLVGVYRK